MKGERASRDDEVDLLIDSWAKRLPEVDLTPLDVVSRFRRVWLHWNELRVGAFRSVGLATWEFDVLAALRRADEPHELSPAQLIDLTMIGSAAMTNRVDKLLLRGLIVRRANPGDGRGVLVRLTPEGITVVDNAMRELVRREEVELAPLTAADRDTLVRILRQLMEEAPRRRS